MRENIVIWLSLCSALICFTVAFGFAVGFGIAFSLFFIGKIIFMTGDF